jgi:hypothetical protein
MRALSGYVRRNFSNIDSFAGFIGTLGLGGVLLHLVKYDVMVAWTLVYFMAFTKMCLWLYATRDTVVPRNKFRLYITAWWLLAIPLLVLMIGSAILFVVVGTFWLIRRH